MSSLSSQQKQSAVPKQPAQVHTNFNDLIVYLVTEPCPHCDFIPNSLKAVEGAYSTGDEKLLRGELIFHRTMLSQSEVRCGECRKTFDIPEHLRPKPEPAPVVEEPVADLTAEPTQKPVAKRVKKQRVKKVKAKLVQSPTVVQSPSQPERVAVIDLRHSEFWSTLRAIADTHPQSVQKALGNCDSMQLHTVITDAIALSKMPLEDRLGNMLSGALSRDAAAPAPVDAEPPWSYQATADYIGPVLKRGTCSVRWVEKLIKAGELTLTSPGRVDPDSARVFVEKKKA